MVVIAGIMSVASPAAMPASLLAVHVTYTPSVNQKKGGMYLVSASTIHRPDTGLVAVTFVDVPAAPFVATHSNE